MCDFVYTVLLEELKARLLVERQVSATFMAMGADVELIDVDEGIREFNEWLLSEPEVVEEEEFDPEIFVLRKALGLRV